MNAEVFAEWLNRQGHHVFKTPNSYWYDQGPNFYQSFPYHWMIKPSEDELSRFLLTNYAFGLRYSTYLNFPIGKISYHAVCEKPYYGFENLSKWARKNIRRGLKNCKVKQITFDRLAKEGLILQIDTLNRQGRKLDLSYEIWQRRCLSAADLPGFDVWGALVDDCLAASVITFQMDDCVYMLYQQCLREFLPGHVNNALSFVVTQNILDRPGVQSILYGLHSLDAPVSVDQFKFRMGYVPKPVRQRVVFHPWLAPLFNKKTHVLLKKVLSLRPGSPSLAKAEGMVRFYLEGKLPLQQQTWPEPLLMNSAINLLKD